MNDLFVAIILVISGILSLGAFLLMLVLLFSGWVERTHQVIATRPGRAFVVGLVNFLFFGVLALVFFAQSDSTGNQIIALPGLLILGVLVVALAFGLAAFTRLLGERIAPTRGPLSRTLLSTSVITLASLLPIVGWLLLFPYLVFTGIGGVILVIMAGRNA